MAIALNFLKFPLYFYDSPLPLGEVAEWNEAGEGFKILLVSPSPDAL